MEWGSNSTLMLKCSSMLYCRPSSSIRYVHLYVYIQYSQYRRRYCVLTLVPSSWLGRGPTGAVKQSPCTVPLVGTGDVGSFVKAQGLYVRRLWITCHFALLAIECIISEVDLRGRHGLESRACLRLRAQVPRVDTAEVRCWQRGAYLDTFGASS